VGKLAQAWAFTPGAFEAAIDSTVAPANAVLRGQPVVAHAVSIAGKATDLVLAGDENGYLFALDANATQKAGSVVWYAKLGNETVAGCNGTPRVVGIQSAVTIDRAANGGAGAVFVAVNGAVHALGLATGVELSGWPVSIPNFGAPATDGFSHDAINEVPGVLYVGTSSNCDNPPYFGRLLRVNIATAQLAASWYTLSGNGTVPKASGGGIWGKGGVAIDKDATHGGIYVATGNALLANAQAPYAESIVNLRRDLSGVVGSTAPALPAGDNDYGTTPAVFQPAACPAKLVAAPNKIGLLVVARIGAGGALHPWQQITMANNTGNFRGSLAWDPADQLLLVTTPTDGPAPFLHGLSALRVNAHCSALELAWQVSPPADIAPSTDPFTPVSVANGVVYMSVLGPTEKQLLAIAAHAGSGTAAGQVLWSSPALAGLVDAPPTVVNGRVFMASYGKVYAFGVP
jgi:hypothetical protein